MDIQTFFDENTYTFTYIVIDKKTKKCAIIDPVLDFDFHSGKTWTASADKLIDYVKEHGLEVQWILETHAHADHLTGAHYLNQTFDAKIGIGEHIKDVLALWVPIFNIGSDTPLNGSQFGRLFKDGEHFTIGTLDVKVLHTPGHTPACVSYLINDEVIFVGDTLFMPYLGTARADFPGGNAEVLYDSIQKILALPGYTQIMICHDYPQGNQKPSNVSTVKEQKKQNIMINETIGKENYIVARNLRDSDLKVPKLLLPSIQVNLRAGYLGAPEENGVQYMKIPLNQL
ncbi:MAG: MBL fold metallo-hydrolase [Legionellaceae bacterium]|nr:MBL fold metallo-hydrolase [Legionellaceae bacterium]